jgi:hypothetical protein
MPTYFIKRMCLNKCFPNTLNQITEKFNFDLTVMIHVITEPSLVLVCLVFNNTSTQEGQFVPTAGG